MTQQRDIERLLDHWFGDGPTEAPDRVIDRIADRIERQSQRHAWRLQRRPYPMNAYAKIAVAVAAVLIVALVGYNLLPANNKGIGGPNPPPTARPSATPSTNPSPTPSTSPSAAAVHLKVGTIESDTSPAAQALATFADEVTRSTGGQVVVDVRTQAVSDVSSKEEHILVTRLKSGDFDLALIPTRAWGAEGVTSFHATMAPFLIDSDPLAAAVAQDPIAATMLEGLTGLQLQGLAMWPEDLRHPVSFGTPFLSPSAFKGVAIRALPSDVTTSVIAAFGGHAVEVTGDAFGNAVADGSIGGAESGFLNAASLPIPGTYTVNVTFFPRMDVLVTRPGVLTGLTGSQRDAILAAAQSTTQQVIGTHPTDAARAQTYCATGGHAAVANAAQLAAFRAAAKPVMDGLLREAQTKTLVDRISEIKASLPAPDPGAACG
jgi:TRAP-type C4-dicarboxylate transport system substrate-binding protein